MIVFTVAGRPAAQGSKRIVARHGRVRLIEQSTKVKPWRACVADAARALGAVPLDGDVEVRIWLLFARPARDVRKDGTPRPGAPARPGRIDVDKGARAILDALTGVCWHDDRQVCRLGIERVWADGSANEGARIFIDQCPST